MFLPTTKEELIKRGVPQPDVILVTGDSYIDSPFIGAAVIGKTLEKAGFSVGIIAQPEMDSPEDIIRLGEPRLFWGITAGAVDSMVANYTATKKRRKTDDYTPGGLNNRRPDRAVIAYTNLVKRYFKATCPIVLGGMEASLRRMAHYDFWSNRIRRSILFDAKADYLIYGMGENSVVELARVLQNRKDNPCPGALRQEIFSIRGLCHISKTPPGLCGNAPAEPPTAGRSSLLERPVVGDGTVPFSLSVGRSYEKATDPAPIPVAVAGKSGSKSRSERVRYTELPPFDTVKKAPKAFIRSFHTFYRNNDAATATGLFQKQDDRYLIQNPPALLPDTAEMDRIHDLEYERELHPYYEKMGPVKALDTIRFSITTHRGCYGECNFCAIAVHEGRTVRWRSENAIVKEVEQMTSHPEFKGIISDVGGPTANMYGFECRKKLKKGPCPDKRCLFPATCPTLMPDHSAQRALLRRIRAVKGVRKVFVASGIRYDLILADKKQGRQYLAQIVRDHVSGQMKIAPEHVEREVLDKMGKPGSPGELLAFKHHFDDLSEKAGKKQFLTYYLMAAHPGCTRHHMAQLKQFIQRELGIRPEQVQIFTPTPSTYATLMYATGIDPFSGHPLFVEKNPREKEKQKTMITDRGKFSQKNRFDGHASSKPSRSRHSSRGKKK